MARLEVRLLGSIEVTLDGQPVRAFESDKDRALLAYLAVESDRPHRRQRLAGLLWPDSTERSARANLRRALSRLRSALGDAGASRPVLRANAQTVGFDPTADVWVDVLALQHHLAEGSTEWPPEPPGRRPRSAAHDPSPGVQRAIAHLRSAGELYRGPFLEGFALADSSEFEEWALVQGEQLRRQVLDGLYCLVEALAGTGEPEQALRYAWRQVGLEPWREAGHRQVMSLLARTGQRSAALAQYEVCRRRLIAEVGVAPSAETTALYERIRSHSEEPDAGHRPARGTGLGREPEEDTDKGPVEQGPSHSGPADGGVARARRRVVLLAAGVLTLMAVLAVLALLGVHPWARGEKPAAGSSPTDLLPQAGPLPPTGALPLRIVFASAELPSARGVLGHIYVMDRDGQGRQRLPGYDEGVEESRPLWLPGREGIVYERIERSETGRFYSLWRMNPDGSGREPLLGGADARAATLSPDGSRIAFVSRQGPHYQLFIANLDGTERVQVTQDDWDIRRPSWSPDGEWIAYDAGDVAASSIWVMRIDGSDRRQLTQGTQDTAPAWSPDGRWIAFVSLRDGNAEIYVMNADGSGQTNVSNAPLAEDRDVGWTPDQRLIFASDRDGDWEIYLMNRNGSRLVQLTHNTVDDRWPDWR